MLSQGSIFQSYVAESVSLLDLEQYMYIGAQVYILHTATMAQTRQSYIIAHCNDVCLSLSDFPPSL